MTRAGTVALAAALGLGVSGCGGSDSDAVSDSVERARDALLGGDASSACASLTPRARQSALAFATEFSRRRPRTCENLARRELDLAQRRPALAPWKRDLRSARIVVKQVVGDAAVVQLVLDGGNSDGPRLRLLRTGDRWLIDGSDAVPVGQ